MKENAKKHLIAGSGSLAAFALWTALIQTVDVQQVGPENTKVGFAAFNTWFHQLTGVHMALYAVTDWLGLVPIAVCLSFAIVGLIQLIKRRSLYKVDADILILGIYYTAVIAAYLLFEMIPINYRPVLIDGFLEASYPSSTTLLVLSVMPTLIFQISRRRADRAVKTFTTISAVVFSLFMVIGRTVSGVHWATDIIGSVLLSAGLFLLYTGVALWSDKRKNHGIQ